MIRALLAGEKTQTRRIVKPQPPRDHSPLVIDRFCPTVIDRYGDEQPGDEVFGVTTENGEWCLRCPYGQPGDTLWVRETIFVQPDLWEVGHGPQPGHYAADIDDPRQVEDYICKPSIHMPRWASRLTLRITDVRVQRLQEISEADARAEGAPLELRLLDSVRLGATASHTGGFERLWESIHGPGSWAANPWVWALTFDVIRANVDEQKP
jgi:hypothetical protein